MSVCVVREVACPPDRIIESSDDFYAQGAEKVLSYSEIANQKIDVFESGVKLSAAAHRNLPSYYHSAEEQTVDKKMAASEWTEMSAGAESFAAALGGSIRFLIAGNPEKLLLKKLYWKPGAMIKSIFGGAGEFAVVAVDETPAESDFSLVASRVFVFEYAGNFDIGEVEGLCVGLPMKSDLLSEVLEWLGIYGKACFSPNDDYDYEPQEADFDRSISRLILDLQGDTLSTNWSFNELKMLIGKVIAESGENQNQIGSQIKGIEFLNGSGAEKQIIVRLVGETELRLRISSHTYLN